MKNVQSVDWRQTSWLFQGSYPQFREGAEQKPEYCGHLAVTYDNGNVYEFGFGTAWDAKGLAHALGVPLTRNGVSWESHPQTITEKER